MFHVKHFGAAGAALLLCAPAHAQTCTIVTNGFIGTYDHELAHCNGWDHPPFAMNVQPPASLVYDYEGKLTVLIGDESWFLNDPFETMVYAQDNANVTISERSVPDLCKDLYRENGYDASSEAMNRLEGCSVRK